MGLARPAEMNGYPGPMHVLDLADELSLTPEQKQQARAARERVMTEAPALGRQIVDKELALDRLFRDGSADEAQIRALTQKIAQLRAELRAIHLQAHLVMQRALAVEQLRTYIEARGHPMPARLRPDTP
jgi:Spy/CpxP family protein refolding chaperone